MERKHAIVIALSFVLVGMMFFSVDTPLIDEEREVQQRIPSPQDVQQIAAEVDSSGNLRTNVIQNPSFEDWVGLTPDGYSSSRTSGYTDVDFAYIGPGVTGNYAALVEAHGSPTDITQGGFSIDVPVSPSPLIEPGISLSFDWNTIANPNLMQGSVVQVQVFIQNSTGAYRSLYYVLSFGTYSPTNTANDAYIMMNDTLNQWNNFDVNITEDFMFEFGVGDLSSTHYIQFMSFRVWSTIGATDTLQAAFDNVVLTDYSYSGWIGNGDFETGTQSPWSRMVSDPGYIEQSTASTHGSYSLNISVPEVTSGAGYAFLEKDFDYPGGILAPSLGETVLELDWKYNDTSGAGNAQSSYLYLRFRNETAYYDMYLYFGNYNDVLPGSNSTFSKVFKIPGFGARDTWQHLSLDLY